MSLPDLAPLADLPAATLQGFAARLRELGLVLAAVAPFVARVASLPAALREPIRRYHLRADPRPLAWAMRMLLFADPVTPAESRRVLGELADPLFAAGLVVRRPEGVVSPFVLSVVDDLYVLSDPLTQGADAVMGLSEDTTALCRAALPDARIGRALDLGCGAGTCALVLARQAEVVIGSDVNPRAIALARINAALNGVGNVEFRLGSLFAPVAGDHFDLVVSQPPFVPHPPAAPAAVFQYGGPRGDELALALCAGLCAHLAPGGLGVLSVEWPEVDDRPLAERLRTALGPEANLLVLAAPAVTPDEHATYFAAAEHPLLGVDFAAEVLRRRRHLAEVGIRALRPCLTVVERRAPGPGWTETLDVGRAARRAVSRARVDQLLAGNALARDPTRLLASKLRMPAGTLLAQEQQGPGASEPSTLHARFAPEALREPAGLSPDLLILLTFVHEEPTVRAAIERFARQHEAPVDETAGRVLAPIAAALRGGLLEPARSADGQVGRAAGP